MNEFGGGMYFYEHRGSHKSVAGHLGRWAADGGAWRINALLAGSLAMDALWAFWWGMFGLSWSALDALVTGAINVGGAKERERMRRWVKRMTGWTTRGQETLGARAFAVEKKERIRIGKRRKEIFRWIASGAKASSVSWMLATAAGSAAMRRPEWGAVAMRWGRNPIELHWQGTQVGSGPMWVNEDKEIDLGLEELPAQWFVFESKPMGWACFFALSALPWRTPKSVVAASEASNEGLRQALSAWRSGGRALAEAELIGSAADEAGGAKRGARL